MKFIMKNYLIQLSLDLMNNKQMIDYFSVWLSVGSCHPGVYLQVILNNYYEYFDIDYTWNENTRGGVIGVNCEMFFE